MWAVGDKCLKDGRARWFRERGEGWGILGERQRPRGHCEQWLGQRQQEARGWWDFRAFGSLNSQPTDKMLMSSGLGLPQFLLGLQAAPPSESPEGSIQAGNFRCSEQGTTVLPTWGQAQRVHCVCPLPRPARCLPLALGKLPRQ